MNNQNIWICPAHPSNLQKTIINKYNNEHIWALNAKRKKAFNELNLGDICLFGRLRRDEGLRYMGIVKTKKIIEEKTDDWPFKTPSGTYWKYAFTLSSVYEINISKDKARELRGWTSDRQCWLTQTKLSGEHKYRFMNYLINNYSCYFDVLRTKA